MLKIIHLGHYGITKMNLRAQDTIYWPGISKDITDLTQSCTICNQNARAQQKETLQPHHIPNTPWTKLRIDLFELNKIQYMLIVDYHSRFPIVRRLPSTATSSIIKTLKLVLSEHGIPKTIVTDGGPQFRSEF